MKKEGADLVADDALDKLIGYLEKSASDATKEAIKITKADKRNPITASVSGLIRVMVLNLYSFFSFYIGKQFNFFFSFDLLFPKRF